MDAELQGTKVGYYCYYCRCYFCENIVCAAHFLIGQVNESFAGTEGTGSHGAEVCLHASAAYCTYRLTLDGASDRA